MGRKLVRQTFFSFFFSTLASSVTLSILSMTDLVIAGHFIGREGLEAISLALPLIIFIQIVAALMGTGGAIVFSTCLGEGDLEACSRTFTLSVCGAVGCGCVAAVAGLSALDAILLVLGAPADGSGAAAHYIGILMAGLPVMILAPVMMTFLRNDSRQGYSMFCVITGALVNVVLSLLLCVVCSLGIAGIAAATVISQFLACILAGWMMFRKTNNYGLVRNFYSRQLLLAILKPGSTVALIFFCQVLLTVVVNRLLMVVGGAAVYAIVKYLINFLFALFDGVSGAVQPMLGIYYGEREQKNIRVTAEYSLKAMLILAFLMFLVMELAGKPLCSLFGVAGTDLEQVTIRAVRIMGIYCFGAAVVTFLNSFYRCVGKAGISFGLSIFDNLLFPLLGCMVLVPGLGLGVNGIFLGLAWSGFATLLLWFLFCQPWKNGVLLLGDMDFPENEDEYHEIIPVQKDKVNWVMDSVEEYCLNMNIDSRKRYYIHLSIEELIVNVLSLAELENQKKHRREYYADIRIYPVEKERVHLRIRDNLTEWTPAALDISDVRALAELEESGGMNELGLEIIKKIASDYSYKRTIGFNNFLVTL